MSSKRQFSSGSRQAPDPCDQYLEQRDFYRKHTARDASCLFRVVSEQMYDTQLHHLPIRKRCVTYMRKNRKFFESMIERDFYEYLDDMSKPKTYGTLVELEALSMMYERDVILFEPFDLGSYFRFREFNNDVFRIFYTPERHFDSIFTAEFIHGAAICQSICYEILYKDLFKIPDVTYAVERMLHLSSLQESNGKKEHNNEGYCTRLLLDDGRFFEFDLPQNTNCILENHELCNFHCSNFPKVSNELPSGHDDEHDDEHSEQRMALRKSESLLPLKYVSCVRQLLDEGITPFPYKVAKALDPTMYRNIEFDAWNETRKELRLQNWYHGDSNFKRRQPRQRVKYSVFQVGAKCHVKLRKSEGDLYTCHIQEIAIDKGYCIVFVEQLGQKRMVPYEALSPLPIEQFKPWSLPYRFHRHMHKYSAMRYTRHQYNYRFRYNSQLSAQSVTPASAKAKAIELCYDSHVQTQSPFDVTAAVVASQQFLKQFTHLENFTPQSVEYLTMPVKVKLNEVVDADEKCDGNNNIVASSSVVANTQVELPSTSAAAIADGSAANDEPLAQTSTSYPIEEQSLAVANNDIVENVNCKRFDNIDLSKDTDYGISPVPCDYSQFTYQPSIQYAAPEEYCMPLSYGMGGNMYHQPVPTYMAANNAAGGTVYYHLYDPNALSQVPYSFAPVSQSGNFLINHAPTSQTSHALENLHPPTIGMNSYIQPLQVTAYNGNPSYADAAAKHLDQRGARGYLSSGVGALDAAGFGRINFDAKRSVQQNGSDLPTDVATLRHFYNIGVDCQRRHQHHVGVQPGAEQETSPEVRENNVEIVATGDRHTEESAKGPDSKFDANQNCAPTVVSNRNSIGQPKASKALLPTPEYPSSSLFKPFSAQFGRRSFNTRYYNNNCGRERNQYRGGNGSSGWGGSSSHVDNNGYGSAASGWIGGGNTGNSRHNNPNHPSNTWNATPVSSRSSHYAHASDLNGNSNNKNKNNNNGHNVGPSSSMTYLSMPPPQLESNAGRAVSPTQFYGAGGGGSASDLCQTQTPTGDNHSNVSTYMSNGPYGGEYAVDPPTPPGQFACAPPPPTATMQLPATSPYGVYGQASALAASAAASAAAGLQQSMQVVGGVGGGMLPHSLGPAPPIVPSFMRAPPPSHHAGGGAGGGIYPTPNVTAELSSLVEHHLKFNYPPPAPFYYPQYMPSNQLHSSLTANMAAAVGSVGPVGPPPLPLIQPSPSLGALPASQGFWCTPPPSLSAIVPQQAAAAAAAAQPPAPPQPPQQQQQQQQPQQQQQQQQPSALPTGGAVASASTSGNTGNGSGNSSGMVVIGGTTNRRGGRHHKLKE